MILFERGFLRAVGSAVLLVGVLAVGGCSESTAPAGGEAEEVDAQAEISFDPAGDTFVIRSLTQDDPERPGRAHLELIGSDLQVDPEAQTVSLEVVLRNLGSEPLRAPCLVWIRRLLPSEVTVANSDVAEFEIPVSRPDGWPLGGKAFQTDPPDTTVDPPPRPHAYGFDYSETFGDDEILEPDETSAARTWIFNVPGLTPFSFQVVVRPGSGPEGPIIAGSCYLDQNRNGRREVHEPPVRGRVMLQPPEGESLVAGTDDRGRYHFPVTNVGLYEVAFQPIVSHFVEVHFTTPNPLQVVLTPGPDGQLQGFGQAHFGVFFREPPQGPPPVQFTERSVSEVESDPYQLERIELRGDILQLRVGFGGCQPDHPFTLYMAGGFMESYPVQANLVLVHDDLDEPCDAAFVRELAFDLGPIRRLYVAGYGEPDVIILRFWDYEGEIHTLSFGP